MSRFTFLLICILNYQIFLCENVSAKSCLINLYDNGFEEDIVENTQFAGDVSQIQSTEKPICGKNTSFLESFDQKNNFITVKIDGVTHDFMPIALYRKNQNFKCNRIKIRSACFDVREQGNKTVAITLFDKDTESKGSAQFVLDKMGRIDGIHPEFALIKASQKTRNGKIVLAATQIKLQLEEFRTKMRTCASNKARNCKSALESVAENWVLERLRYERFPRRLSQSEINDDWQHFRDAQGHLGSIERAIDEIMLRNEAGKASPYELSDATKGKSGLSFGVRQLDIGGNEIGQRIFRADLAPHQSSWIEAQQGSKNFIYGEKILSPIRDLTPDQLFFIHSEVPQMTHVMREAYAKDLYDSEHKRFLKAEAAKFFRLRQKCGFSDSPILALLAIDRENQLGTAKSIEKIVQKGCSSGSPVVTIESAAINSFAEYRYRAENIVNISRKNALK